MTSKLVFPVALREGVYADRPTTGFNGLFYYATDKTDTNQFTVWIGGTSGGAWFSTVGGASPAIGDGTGQTTYNGGAKLADSAYALHATRTGLITDYIVSVTDTTADVIYQAVPMGAVTGQRVPLIVKDESYGATHVTASGAALTHTITVKPVSGKKLNNVVDGTLVILNAGGVISVLIDENDNMHQLGFTA